MPRKRVAERFDLPIALETLLNTFEHLCPQVAMLDAEIERFAESDPVCKRLMEMPGIGPMISYTFTAYVDDPSRFRNADHLASYLALVPGEATTGGKAVPIQGPWRCSKGDDRVEPVQARAKARRPRGSRVRLASGPPTATNERE